MPAAPRGTEHGSRVSRRFVVDDRLQLSRVAWTPPEPGDARLKLRDASGRQRRPGNRQPRSTPPMSAPPANGLGDSGARSPRPSWGPPSARSTKGPQQLSRTAGVRSRAPPRGPAGGRAPPLALVRRNTALQRALDTITLRKGGAGAGVTPRRRRMSQTESSRDSPTNLRLRRLSGGALEVLKDIVTALVDEGLGSADVAETTLAVGRWVDQRQRGSDSSGPTERDARKRPSPLDVSGMETTVCITQPSPEQPPHQQPSASHLGRTLTSGGQHLKVLNSQRTAVTTARSLASPRTVWDIRSPAAAGAARAAAAAGLDTRPVAYLGELLFPSDAAGRMTRLDALELHAHVVIIILSTAGEIEFWNHLAAHVTGIPATSAVGQDIRAFLPLEEQQETMASLIESAAERTADGSEEVGGDTRRFVFIRSDGVNYSHLQLSVCGGHTDGRVMAVGVPCADGGWRIGYAQWVMEQIRGPLGQISSRIAQSTDLALAADLKRPLNRATDLSRSLSSDLKSSMSEWAPLRISAMLQRVVAEHAEMGSQYDVEVRMAHLPADLLEAEMYTDCLQLPRAIAYLLNNAIRFSVAGGVVSVSAKLSKAHEDDLGSLVVTVEDTGEGMPGYVTLALDKEDADEETGAPGLVSTSQVIRELGGRLEFGVSALEPVSPTLTLLSGGNTRRRGTEPTVLVGSPTQRQNTGQGTAAIVTLPFLAPEEQGISVDSLRTRTRHGTFVGQSSPRASVSAVSPFSPAQESSPSGPRGQPDGQQIRALLIEPSIVHRMSFCHHLWQRGYLMTVAASPQDVAFQLSKELLDVVIVDVEASDEMSMVVDRLKRAEVQVLLAGRRFNELQKEDIREHGWFFVHLPVNSKDLAEALDGIEAQIQQVRDDQKRIKDLRECFKGGMQSVSWEKGRMLGKGSFAKVYEATNKLTGARLAVKVIQLDGGRGEQARGREMSLLREVQVMSGLTHPNIVHYFWSEQKEDELLVFMEYAKDGCLSAKIPQGGMKAEKCTTYMAGIVRGLAYLHSEGIIHRDMKVANVLLINDVPKITDFGTAVRHTEMSDSGDDQRRKEGFSELAGTPQYMSPEVLNGSPAGMSADVWATGCLLVELSTAQQPFAHAGDGSWSAVRYVSALKPTDRVDLGPHQFHELVESFLRQCIIVDPEARWTAEQLMKHPFVDPLALTVLPVSPRRASKDSAGVSAGRSLNRARPPQIDGVQSDGGSDDGFSGWGSPKARKLSARLHRLRELLSPEGGASAAPFPTTGSQSRLEKSGRTLDRHATIAIDKDAPVRTSPPLKPALLSPRLVGDIPRIEIAPTAAKSGEGGPVADPFQFNPFNFVFPQRQPTGEDQADLKSIGDFEVGMQVYNPAQGQGEVYSITNEGDGAVMVQFGTGEVVTYRRQSLNQGRLQPADVHRRERRRSSCWSTGPEGMLGKTFCTGTAPRPQHRGDHASRGKRAARQLDVNFNLTR
eukprot:TRINITY_DN11834_c0_g1_i1.p1 TRINITY_DN11834_c0_g1~~TRINITY_DN11834_c0_g1_i1.p1  ORF type:complete len:1464 (+),score=302.92 TRINITY_DN11834_c0_g1_i1:64-4455(+)